ncbi:MAG: HD domain-containing phosphohydrolase [Solirubrobacterales bacterium]
MRPRRAATAIAINVGCGAAALALFVAVGPRSDWGEPATLGALAAIAAFAFMAELRFHSALPAYFDASLVLALIALAVAGPLPALCVWVIPDFLSRFVFRQDRILTPGMVATVSGQALAALVGYGVLSLAAIQSTVAGAPALYTAGLVMACVQFSVGRLLVAPYYQGLRPAALIRNEFLDIGPAVMAMLAVGVVIAALLEPLGSLALAPLAIVILVPQFAFASLTRSRSVARLGPVDATRVYADALARELRLSGLERRLVDATVDRIGRVEAGGWLEAAIPDPPLTGFVALGIDERWDGTGRPFGIPAEATPRASRVIAVAKAWSSLTAADSARLPHTEAILDLAARAGTEFDPVVVEAAADIVASEGAITRSADFEPRLHRLPLPATVRRRGLPALGARLGARA